MSATLIDINAYHAKLAANERISEDETVALIKELQHFRRATAYLASCHAATLESLPKSASASSRSRQTRICLAAARLLAGDASDVAAPFSTDITSARDRCVEAGRRQESKAYEKR